MNVISFINILKDHPSIGFLIGIAFFVVMFSAKNLVVYLYSRQFEKEKAARECEVQEDNENLH